MKTLYIRSNILIRTFSKCNEKVKIELFKSYCTSLYSSHLWSTYRKSIYSKIRVVYNNVFRKLLRLPPRSSVSHMFATNNILNFEALIISKITSFIERLEMKTLCHNYTCKYSLWKQLQNLLYT